MGKRWLVAFVALFASITLGGGQPASAHPGHGGGGPMVLDGMDPVCHAVYGEGTENYIAKVLNSVYAQSTMPGNNGRLPFLVLVHLLVAVEATGTRNFPSSCRLLIPPLKLSSSTRKQKLTHSSAPTLLLTSLGLSGFLMTGVEARQSAPSSQPTPS